MKISGTRIAGIIAAFIAAFILAVPLFAQGVVPTFSNPTFWTCENPPALPAGVPGAAATAIAGMQTICGENRISGWLMTVGLADATGNVPAGTMVIQNITAAGIHGRTTATSTSCGDDLAPFAIAFTEYFSTPVLDLHLTPFCCEETYLDTTKAQVAFLALPAGAQPIPAGERAGAAATTAAQARAIRNNVRQNSTLNWGYTQEYDGCDPANPATTCGKTHCLDRWSQSRTPIPGGGGFNLGPVAREAFDATPP